MFGNRCVYCGTRIAAEDLLCEHCMQIVQNVKIIVEDILSHEFDTTETEQEE